MQLTPEEEAERRRLRRELELEDDRKRGDDHLERAAAQRPPPPQKTRKFSLYRFGVGMIRGAVQGLIETADDLGHAAGRATGIGGFAFGRSASNGIVEYLGYDELERRGGDSVFGTEKYTPTLPQPEGAEHAGTAERVAVGIGSYAIPFIGWARALGVARAATRLGSAGRAMVAGAAVDFTQEDPVSGNLANVLRDGFGLKSDVLDALAAEEDDDALETRFRAAAVGAPVGLLGDAVFEVGSRTIRAYRAWKGTAEEAAATVEALKKDIKLDPKARNLPAPLETGASKSNEGAFTKEGSAKPDVEDAEFSDIPQRPYDPTTDTKASPQVTDFEDVLDYLKRQTGNMEVDEETAARFAQNLLFGDPENALAKIGIDPAKLDFSKFDDPDLLGRLQRGLGELYEVYASKLGRSNLRVTEAATVSAARSLASTADILKTVHGSSANLAEELMGARMFVGAHAHKLLALADEAADEIIKGGAGAKWGEFLEAFHRHAYYLGTLRGAGSEVGRALRSLQMIAKVSKPKAAKTVADALDNEAAETGRAVAINRVAEGASEYAQRLLTDAEKLEALARLKALGGDVGELSRHVRRENMSILKRLDGALKETVGNLFSTGTAVYNLASGATMLGARVLQRSMAMMGRLALAPFGGREAGAAARLAVMDTWAYTHGLVSGFAPAFANTIRVLEKEGGSELALNFDSLGLGDLAVKAAQRSNRAATELADGSFERADVKSYRNLAILPSEWRKLQQTAREMPGPVFLQEGLAAFARVVAGSVNAVGSLSRLGTILFINLPDQFIGTMAAQAGAYSFAVRTAAKEAAELGLDGKELSEYLKARTVQLAEHPEGWADDGFDAGAREAMGAAGEVEAREVLFQDDLELGFSRGIERAFTQPGFHIIAPFVKTPLRILERTAIDYTPLGLLKDRVRKAIVAGGPERDEAIARLSLSMIALGVAYDLADDRTIVGNDGGYTSSARMTRSSYSLKIGDDSYEFGRIDPLGTILGFAADLRAFKEAAVDDPDADDVIGQATEAFIWGIAANVLSKTWLTSLRNLTDLAGATSDEDASARVDRFLQGFGNRVVPASGVQRQIAAAGDGFLRQAMSFGDQVMKASVGSPTLPLRRDALLGRPIPMEGFNRIIGIRGGPSASEVDDPLAAEMERLSFKVPGSRRTVEGVKLTAAQYSRLLELKGQVVRHPSTGLTLEETLETLVGLPEYASMADAARVQAIRDEMDGFSRLAVDQLLREDDDFAYKVLRQEVFDKNTLRGGSRNDAESEVQRLARELGLTPSP